MSTRVGVACCTAVIAAALPSCDPNGTWPGAPCTWPSSPPAGCPFQASATFTGVSFSGKFGAYPTTGADTWYPYPSSDGSLFTTFADGHVCTSPGTLPPLPADVIPLLWYWSADAEDNVLTTAAHPPTPPGYEYIGVMGYGVALNGSSDPNELQLWYGRSDYFTTAGPADEAEARAAGYTLVASLGATMPPLRPMPDPRPLPPTTSVNMPAGEAGWSLTSLFYSAARNDHFTSPEPIPTGYSLVRTQGYMDVVPALGSCASVQGTGNAEGAAVLSGADPFNLTVAGVGTVTHPHFNVSLPGVPPPYGVYPSTAFEFRGTRWVGYYLLADSNGACGNWCRLGPLLAFGFAPAAPPPANGSIPDAWSFEGSPLWGGAGEARGVFEPINVSGAPLRMGVPRFADLGPDLVYSPDGRAYLIAKGCAANDGLHCSFMTGDAAFLARTVAPMAALVDDPASLNNASAWEFYAGTGGEAAWAPTLAEARPLFEWPSTVGGLTLTYLPAQARFIMVVNLPSDHVRPTDASFDTYVLEAAAITGPYALVSYMQSLGPQMYFQQISSVMWSGARGTTGVLFSSGNWDVHQGSNPPGERYGLVTTEFTLEKGAGGGSA